MHICKSLTHNIIKSSLPSLFLMSVCWCMFLEAEFAGTHMRAVAIWTRGQWQRQTFFSSVPSPFSSSYSHLLHGRQTPEKCLWRDYLDDLS